MGHIDIRPRAVRRWGHAAKDSGHDVRTAKSKVGKAAEDAGRAHLTGLSVDGASRRFTSTIESTIASVASAVTGTGGQLLSTVTIVTSTDDASADLFKAPQNPWANKPRWDGSRP